MNKCIECGAEIAAVGMTGRPKEYCSNKCRVKAHRKKTVGGKWKEEEKKVVVKTKDDAMKRLKELTKKREEAGVKWDPKVDPYMPTENDVNILALKKGIGGTNRNELPFPDNAAGKLPVGYKVQERVLKGVEPEENTF